jgi:DNA-binding SARP family transcriptional activator
MDFRLLGPFGVERDGNPVALGGRRQRAILALLTMHVGQVLSTDRIAEEIWEGDPPPSATRTVHSYVSRLRSVLRGPDGDEDLLVRREPGYVLDVNPEDVDAVRFERLVASAVAALDADDPLAANQGLRQALDLWRGEALADFAYDFFAATESQRLDGRRLEALELRIDTDLGLARHAQVVVELESLVATHPLRERFWAQLMVALYRCGRQSDALAAFGRVRRTLVDELGLEPGEELRQLEAQVLDQSEELALPGLPPGAGRFAGSRAPADRVTSRRIPLPDRLHIRPDVGVIGRDEETRLMAEATERATGDRGRAVLLVSGEAGQGKSTVVAEAARAAFEDGAIVLSGHCEEDVTSPYQLFVETLGHYALYAPDDELSAQVEDSVAELAALLPPLARRVPDIPPVRAVDPDTERYKLFASVVEFVARMTHEHTVVLVLDDLQWADVGSLQLLRHLVTSDRPMRLVVLGTFRDSELAASDPLVETLGALRRTTGVERIELSGFEPAQVVSVMEAIAGQTMDDPGVALAHAIHRETDGNPFFVDEVLRHLFETGALRRDDDGRWVAPEGVGDVGLPAGVREVIDARVVRLGRASAANLSLAAVIGRDFDLDLLLAAAETTPDELLDILEEAATVALVREPADRPGWYSFSHALIQRTLYEGAGASRRNLYHRKVFDVLVQWSEDGPRSRSSTVAASELARHLVACARPDESRSVVEYASRAAEEALSALNPDEAVRWYSTAFDALGDDPADVTRAQVLSRLGDARRQTGDLTYRETLLEAARLALEFDDVDTLVFAALANSRQIQSTTGNIDQERVDVIEAAIEKVGTEDAAERAMLLAHLAVDRSYDGEPEGRRPLVDEALSIARRVGDPATLFDVLLRRIGIWMPEDVGQRLTESAEALAIAEALADPVARFWALFYRSIVAAEAGDRVLLDECRARFPEEARVTGQPMLQWVTSYAQGWQQILEGDLEGAERLANQALELGGATGQPDAMSIFGGQLVDLRWHQGRDVELVELIEQLVVSTPDIDSFRSALARIYGDIGRTEDARALLAAEAEVDFAHPFDPLAGTTIVMWAEVAIQIADKGAAEVLLTRLATFADQVVCNGVDIFGSLDHYRGALWAVLENFDEAERLLTRGAAVHEGLRAPFFEARSQLELARLLQARDGAGDRADSLRRAGSAVAIARKHGYATVERRGWLTGRSAGRATAPAVVSVGREDEVGGDVDSDGRCLRRDAESPEQGMAVQRLDDHVEAVVEQRDVQRREPAGDADQLRGRPRGAVTRRCAELADGDLVQLAVDQGTLRLGQQRAVRQVDPAPEKLLQPVAQDPAGFVGQVAYGLQWMDVGSRGDVEQVTRAGHRIGPEIAAEDGEGAGVVLTDGHLAPLLGDAIDLAATEEGDRVVHPHRGNEHGELVDRLDGSVAVSAHDRDPHGHVLLGGGTHVGVGDVVEVGAIGAH